MSAVAKSNVYLTLDQVRRDKEEHGLFVINNTREAQGEAGEIIFGVNVGGIDLPIKIFMTWIPVDLSEFAEKTAIIAHPHFLRCVQQQMLKLVSREHFESVMNTADGQAEYDRLRILRGNYDAKTAQQKINAKTPGFDPNAPQRNLAKGQGQFEENVTPSVVALMNRTDYTPKQKIGALRQIEQDLSDDDKHYIFARAEDDELKTWARERLPK